MVKSIAVIWLSFGLSSVGLAQEIAPVQAISQSEVVALLENMPAELWDSSRAARTEWISGELLKRNIPYGTVCGDGPNGDYQQGPLATFSQMDCVTFVEPVLALASIVEKDATPQEWYDSFYDHLRNIKYSDPDNVCYATRNHFVSLDWLPHQIKSGLLSDISAAIYERVYRTDVDQKITAPVRRVFISKQAWYASKTEKDIQCPGLDEQQIAVKLAELQALGKNYPDTMGQMPYIPIGDLLSRYEELTTAVFTLGEADMVFFNMIRGDNRASHIPVVTSHQGFLVRTESGIMLRHATSMTKYGKKVTDVPFETYLNDVKTWTTWPVLGFNFNKIEDN